MTHSTLSRRKFLEMPSGLLVDKRPNIVFILADDLGFGDLGCFGGKIETPNIDRMARMGTRCTNFHSGAPVCSPSRVALLTGYYSNRTGIDNVLHPDSNKGISLNWTVADTLRSTGYHTMCAGKWHVGHKWEFMPNSKGFNQFWGIPWSSDMPLIEVNNEEVMEDLEPKRDLLNLLIAEKAAGFVRGAPLSSPYFLYLAPTAMHLPLLPSPEFKNKSGLGAYSDTLLELDFAVGEVLRAVETRDADQGTSTLVMFSSDNGADMDTRLPSTDRGNNGQLSGGKFDLKEGGIRVPFIAYLPGVIPEGRVTDELLTSCDIKPTLGMGPAKTSKWPIGLTDGVNIWSFLKSETPHVERINPILGIYDGFVGCALKQYSLNGGEMHTFKTFFPRRGTGDELRLYDLSIDLSEHHDIAVENPDIVAIMIEETREVLQTFPPGVVGSSIL